MKKCVFAGSFDPFTLGHADIVERCLALFDEVVVAVLCNRQKRTMFTEEERMQMLEAVYRDVPRVRVVLYDGLLVDLLREENTNIYVRGVRDSIDCTYETEILRMNEHLLPQIITVFIPSPSHLLFMSSTFVRNAILFHKPVEEYVPKRMQSLLARFIEDRK